MASNILQEYLVLLGFTTDERSAKKATSTMLKVDLSAKSIAKGVAAAGVAVQAFVAIYAYQMEKLYYASKRSGASVDNLQALEYGFKQVGGQSGVMTGAIEGMARALRANPGLTGLLNNLGVKVTGRDKSDVMIDLVKALNRMPFYQAQQYASLFGIDPDTLYSLQQGMDKLEKMREARKQMAKDAGLDLDKAAEAGMVYANTLSTIAERFGILKDVLAVKLLPVFQEWAASTDKILGDLTRIIGKSESFGDFLGRMGDWFKSGNPNGGVKLTPEARARLDQMGVEEPKAGTWLGRLFQMADKVERQKQQGTKLTQPTSPNSEVRANGDSRAYTQAPPGRARTAQERETAPRQGDSTAGALFSRLESIYKLPEGLLDRMWKKESNRGDPRFMQSHAGAQGHFQFMPGTAKQYGLDDPNDLQKSATAAAQFLADLMRKYGGDVMKATAAYNWGPGNVDRYGLGRAPAETRDYVKTLTGKEVGVQQTNNYNITGKDADTLAKKVAKAQEESNASLVRDLKQRVY